MASRKFVTLTPETKREVVDDILKKLEPAITQAVQDHLKSVFPQLRDFVKGEIGKWAVSEKDARAFIDGMVADAAEKTASRFRPRWLAKILFRDYYCIHCIREESK